MKFWLIGLTLAISPIQASTLYINEAGAGSAPESGLTVESGEAPDGAPALVVGGDPDGPYSKFYNERDLDGSKSMFIVIPAGELGQPFTLSYDVWLPLDSQIESSEVGLHFYRDLPKDGSINFDGDEENKIHEQFYGKTLFDVTDQWQTVTVSGTIPEVDKGNVDIDALRFSISFKQVDYESNATPISAYVRNIVFETISD